VVELMVDEKEGAVVETVEGLNVGIVEGNGEGLRVATSCGIPD
jgi:hypothetical protein